MQDFDIKVGDTFYCHDSNSRVYLSSNELDYRKCYREAKIIEETSRSFVVKAGPYTFKVPKKDPFAYMGGEYGFSKKLLTKQEMEDELFIKVNRAKMVDAIIHMKSVDVLRRIKAIMDEVK